jgi:HlyD family secretion protein
MMLKIVQMKKYLWWWIILGVAVLGTGIWYFGFYKEEKPVVLDTVTPFYGTISKSVTATGSLQPVDTVAVGTQESGTLAAVLVDFNSVVKKGQLIAQLDKSLLNASVSQYVGALASAQSQVVYEQANYDRQQLLYNTGAISKADYETAMYQYQSAEGNVNSIASQLKAAKQNLAYASIYSPIDGTVMSRNISVGQTVAASFNTPTLFVIAKDLTKMQVQAAVDEADIGNVKNGQKVTFTVDAFPTDVFVGSVEDVRLEPSTSANVVTYSTIIAAPNQDKKLKPGMTANISIFTQVDSGVLLIPAKALKFTPSAELSKHVTLVPDSSASHINATPRLDTIGLSGEVLKKGSGKGKKASVWIRTGDSLVQKVIRTGLNDDTNVEVLSGLEGDEDIVTAAESEGTPAKTKSSAAATSPFMPKRPGGNTTPKKPAAK